MKCNDLYIICMAANTTAVLAFCMMKTSDLTPPKVMLTVMLNRIKVKTETLQAGRQDVDQNGISKQIVKIRLFIEKNVSTTS